MLSFETSMLTGGRINGLSYPLLSPAQKHAIEASRFAPQRLLLRRQAEKHAIEASRLAPQQTHPLILYDPKESGLNKHLIG